MRLPRRRRAAAVRFAATAPPADDAWWREARWCAIDLELTGLDPRSDEIIAIGAVPIEQGRVLLGECFYSLARPDRPPRGPAVLIHKLVSGELADAPPVSEAIELLLDTLAGRVPVFHTAAVERAFLGRELRRLRLRLPADADTEALGRLWLRERDGASPGGVPLAGLARTLGQRAELAHHALGDALTTAQVFIALAAHFDSMGPQTVQSLRAVGGSPSALQRLRLA
jgi:DNA polymerase III subunit epsilon